MATTPASLPEVDVATVDVAAPTEDVWAALLAVVDRTGSGPARAYARAVGCVPAAADGPRPLGEGSTIPGFAVERAEPGRELVLAGRHRFSRYALTFRLDPQAGQRTRVAAATRAAFPGVHGRAYRLLVIRSGGHAVAVGRILGSIRRRAERR